MNIEDQLNRFALEQAAHDEEVRHNAISESHFKLERTIWYITATLLALGFIFK